MRKLVSVLIAAILLLSLAACGGAEPEPTNEVTTEATTEATSEPTTEATEPTVSEAERLYTLGMEALENGDTAGAQEHFEAARVQNESEPYGWLGLAELLIREYDFEGAEALLNEAMEKTGNNSLIAEKLEMLKSDSVMDSSGRLLRLSGLDEDGTWLFYMTYTYREDGKVDTITSYDGAGNQTGYVQMEYDDQGQVVVDAFFTQDEWIIRRREYDYDEAGNITHERTYTPEGILDRSIISTYNEQNQQIQADQYNAMGLELIYHYSYNSLGLLERWDVCDNNDLLMHYLLYFYNEDGLCTQIQYFEPDGTMFEQEILTYDDAGKLLKREFFDGAGNLLRVYDYD